MIEAKDKEQAVFELMRTFKLPGYDLFNDIIPHVRKDENKPIKATPTKRKATPRKKKAIKDEDTDSDSPEPEPAPPETVPDEEVGMGGPDGRVYWPPTQEHWLRPVKRVMKPKADKKAPPGKELDEKGRIITPAMKRKRAAAAEAGEAAERANVKGEQVAEDAEAEIDALEQSKGKAARTPRTNAAKAEAEAEGKRLAKDIEAVIDASKISKGKAKKAKGKGANAAEAEGERSAAEVVDVKRRSANARKNMKQEGLAKDEPAPKPKRRRSRAKKIDYVEEEEDAEME